MDRTYGRRAYARVIYDGRDITDEISAGLISISFTDSAEEADDIQITVEDREGAWSGPWLPKVAVKPKDEPQQEQEQGGRVLGGFGV